MRAKVQKWGNSLAVRIPTAFVKEAQLAYGSDIEISVEDGRIVILPAPRPEIRLEDLLDRVSDDNRHGETPTGSSVGREVW